MFKKFKPYIISVGIALAVGGLSALLSSGGMDVYSSVNQPQLAPPPWLFPVVWTILFVLMGISAALVYTDKEASKEQIRSALSVYAVQLAFNFFWSLIFFNMRAYLFAFIWLVVLWILIIVMIIRFYSIRKSAGLLQIPYLLWVTFAGYLNFMIYILNK